MKTADNWVEEQSSNPPRKGSLEHKAMCDAVRMIQIDALREAAKIADGIATSTDSINAGRVHFAILSRIKELEKEA